MTAPVARFSLRMPVVEVAIIIIEVREIDREIARRRPIIIVRNPGFLQTSCLDSPGFLFPLFY